MEKGARGGRKGEDEREVQEAEVADACTRYIDDDDVGRECELLLRDRRLLSLLRRDDGRVAHLEEDVDIADGGVEDGELSATKDGLDLGGVGEGRTERFLKDVLEGSDAVRVPFETERDAARPGSVDDVAHPRLGRGTGAGTGATRKAETLNVDKVA